jgi:hypothetical protein
MSFVHFSVLPALTGARAGRPRDCATVMMREAAADLEGDGVTGENGGRA